MPLTLSVLLSAAGCATAKAAPPELHHTLWRDLAYGPHERNLVDLSIPSDAAPEGLILFKLGLEKFFYRLAEKTAGYHVVDGDVTEEGYSERGREVLAAISPISFAGAGHFPGAKTLKGGALRYDRALETRLARVMNEYIDRYCGKADPSPSAGE